MNLFVAEPDVPRDVSARRMPSPPPPPPVSEDEDAIDLRALIARIWGGRWIVAVCTAFALTVGALLATQIEPRFRATASVLFTGGESQIIELGDGVMARAGGPGSLQNEIEILESTNLMAQVVDALRLDRDPEFNPTLRPEEVSVASLAGSWIGSAKALVREALVALGVLSPPPPPPPPDPAAEAERLRRGIVARALGAVSLEPVRDSRVMRVTAVTDDPATSARLVNTLVREFVDGQLQARLDATKEATLWLSLRVAELREQVERSEAAVEAARARIAEETGQGVDVTRQQLQSLNGALSQARARRSAVASDLERLETELAGGGDLDTVPEIRASEVVQGLRARLAGLRAQDAGLAASVASSHPARARIIRRIAELQEAIRQEARRIAETMRNQLESARSSEAALVQEVRELERLAERQSVSDVELRQLQREAEANRALYENFLARLKETSEQQKLEEPEARVLSPAEPPLSAEMASRNRLLMRSGVVGVILGIGIIFLLERLNNTFRTAPEIEEATGLRVSGLLPALGRRVRRRSVVEHLSNKRTSSLSEAVRNLRTSIFLANVDDPPRSVMVTSSLPGEGKSTTSMLLALVSRQMGRSAIIVDCDLRRPSLTDLFENRVGSSGLVSVLEGETSLEDAVDVEPSTGLHALMARDAGARAASNAADLLSSRRFGELLDELERLYDLVILDTPPVLVVTDARIMASRADAVLYAVKWDATPRGAVLEGLKELRSVGAPLTGVVMTMINESKAAYYNYEGYRYYKGYYKKYHDT